MEILQEFSASNDHMIVKGKRTKRPRSSSSASSAANSSPTTSSGISTSREEDEDLANCLILLARGRLPTQTESKFSSRKFTEMETTTTAAAKVGIFVYECKTCSRSFPSFQALGGHRASHKRPKSAAEEVVDEHRPKFSNLNTINAPPPSTATAQLAKIHECSICGSEFASGQALGGHMRRHRSGPNTAAAAAVGRSRSDDDHHSSSHDRIVEKTRSMLTLDLNLPAPAEAETTRGFSSNQQPRIIFPAAALVGCHY